MTAAGEAPAEVGSTGLSVSLPWEAAAPDVEVPPRVLAISVFALAAAAVAGVVRPEGGARFAGFLWILGLIPPFLLSYYHGWTGALRALAGGMVVLTLSEVAAGLLMDGSIDWWIYGSATTGLIVVSLGSGALAELFHRTGGGPGAMGGEGLRRREIRRAVQEGQLQLYFQPIVSLSDRRTVGVEALVRWNHPRRGLLEAQEFVALAESVGLLNPVADWALEEAFRQFSHWRTKFSSSPNFFVALNLSASQCRRPGFVESFRSRLERHGVDGEALQIEVSEETLHQAGTQLVQLAELGAGLAVDDFGTGYVSLGQLARLRIHGLKVDETFVARMTEHDEDRATVDAIIRIGRALGVPVTAEAVETLEQYELLEELGCDLGQGAFFAEPFPATALDGRLGVG